MPDPTTRAAQPVTVRDRTVTVLDELATLGKDFELPEFPETLSALRSKLADNTYNVLVTGEVKRGKSTFVNSLVGRDLLPTGVEVVTSQAFRVTRAAQEAYRVRFVDGSAKEIGAEDLATYGSQVEAGKRKRRRADQEVRWIEIDAPVSFLPEGLSVIDTPGTGSLYRSHAAVTYGLVPYADAVIFCLSSDRPIDQDELEFVARLADITRSIFFIQTMIDRYQENDGAHWKEVKQRNEEILKERFGDRLADTTVWPLSATWLLLAGRRADPNDPLVRLHRDLIEAVRRFLYYVSGWYPAAQAVLGAREYYTTGRALLRDRLVGEVKEAQERQAELRRRKQEFEQNWGPRGRKREELMAAVAKRLIQGRNTFSSALAPQGPVFTALVEKINAVEDVPAANALGETLADEVTAAAAQAWQRVSDGVWRDIDALLAPLAEDATAAALVPSPAALQLDAGYEPMKQSFLTTLSYARGQVMGGYMLGNAGVGVLVMLHIVTGGAAIVPTTFVTLGTLFWGLGPAKTAQVKTAKQNLVTHLHKLLQQAHQYFFAADLDTGKVRVDEYFNEVQRLLAEQIDQIAARTSREVQREIEQMIEAEKLNDQQRRERGERLQGQIKVWDALQAPLQQLTAALERFAPLPGPRPSPQVQPVGSGQGTA